MNIAILSNCQGETLAQLLKEMNPQINPSFHLVSKIWTNELNLWELYRDNDLVIAQPFIRDSARDCGAPEILEKTLIIPSIAYSAFHPDMTYAKGRTMDGQMETIYTPLAHYNSSLVCYAYKNNFSVEQAVALFNEDVFSRLGYLDKDNIAYGELKEECDRTDIDLMKYLPRWKKSGCFMYSFNHPMAFVIESLAMEVMRKINLPVLNKNPARYLDDPLRKMPVWPVYPGIRHEGVYDGDYAFRGITGVIGLREFIEKSYEQYEKFQPQTIECLNVDISLFDDLLKSGNPKTSSNPYKGLPDHNFWKKSVADVLSEEVDPVVSVKFKIDESDKIATAGSCFAQHISRVLVSNGYNYFVPENGGNALDTSEAKERNFGVFSARFGNVYTARQLKQLFERAFGTFQPAENYWIRSDGRYVDPFRPQIEPDGFSDVASLLQSRDEHLSYVRQMFQEMNVFVFTLGLTEGWRSRIDGAVYPLAPGVAGGQYSIDQHEFVNFGVNETVDDISWVIDAIGQINPGCKIILTVSPVPLIATYGKRSALVATTFSKSVLRVAADIIAEKFAHIDYFPSYEIITGNYNKGQYFEEDLRSVKIEGVNHVMKLFSKYYLSIKSRNNGNASVRRLADIVCDEEAILRI